MAAKSLEQLKLDAKASGWPWRICSPADERALLDGYLPSIELANRVRRFFATLLYLPKETGGVKPFRLMDWQFRDVIAPLFGWVKDGKRRFNRAYVSMGKKQGKSTLVSAVALYMLVGDGAEEAEVISCATDRDQAGIVFRKAARAVKLSKPLRRILRCVDSRKQIFFDQTGSKFEAISSDADSSEGINPSCLILDELHVWKDKQFFDSLLYSTIARPQGLTIAITTAGDSDQSLAYGEYQYSKDLLAGENYNPHYFAYIAEAPDGVEWDSEEAWLAAQPSLRGEVDTVRVRDEYDNPPVPIRIGSLETMRQQCEEAKSSPRKRRAFTRYLLNRWVVDAENTWIASETWKAATGETYPHFGDVCAGGLDLSTARDTTSLCLAFRRPDSDVIDLSWWVWLPEDGIKDKEDKWRVPLRDWAAEGWLTLTPGPVIDYRYIRKTISGANFDEAGQRLPDDPEALVKRYEVRAIAFDPWGAQSLCERELYDEDGVPMVSCRQGYRTMSPAVKEFERLLLSGRICHSGNPVATWQSKNAVLQQDPAGNAKIAKDRSTGKVDMIVAAVMAVQALNIEADKNTPATGSLFIH